MGRKESNQTNKHDTQKEEMDENHRWMDQQCEKYAQVPTPRQSLHDYERKYLLKLASMGIYATAGIIRKQNQTNLSINNTVII